MFLTTCLAHICTMIGMAQQPPSQYVEVIYFHGKQRCASCKAIEKHTKELVYADFANQMKTAVPALKE